MPLHTTISPTSIIVSNLYDHPVACGQQFLFKIWVLCEFIFKSFVHKLFFDSSPLLTEGIFPSLPHIVGKARAISIEDVLLIVLSFKLLALIKMFIAFVMDIIDSKANRVDIAEETILIINVIEFNGLLLLHLSTELFKINL